MPLPHLHLFHPNDGAHPQIVEWIAEVERTLRTDPIWDECRMRRVTYDDQAGFNVSTQTDLVRRTLGPVIFIQKVQRKLVDRFGQDLQREATVYVIDPTGPEDIWQTCEQAREAYEGGEPLIPLRELIAYLIIAKLERHDYWGGTALNKSFLWIGDLANGGFPKDICDDRSIAEVANALFREGILTGKKSQGKMKYALGDVSVIQPIIDSKSFASCPQMRKFFDKSQKMVSARLLLYIDN